MKIIVTFIALLIVLASCQKEYTGEISKDEPAPVAVSGAFNAKINSVQWTADKSAGAVFSSEGNGHPRLLSISGLGTDKKAITIMVVDSGVHRYTLGSEALQEAAYIDSTVAGNSTYTTDLTDEEISGYVDITSINTTTKTMSGTFSFKAASDRDTSLTVDISEGSFTNIPYLDGAILPPSTSTDTFHVNINDSLFTAFSILGSTITFNNTMMVQGSDSSASKTVSINFPDSISPGSYSMDSFGYYGLYLDGNSSLGSVSGTLQILENNTTTKRIRGNFNFKAEDPTDPTTSANLTEGYFSVKYQ